MTVVTIVKGMIGVGILGFPNLAKNFGLLIFLFGVFTYSILVYYVNNLMIKCKNLSLHSNYSTIGYYIF